MPKVLVAECKQEVSSFNPVPSRYGDFAVRSGGEFSAYHSSVREEVAGAVDALAAVPGVTVAPLWGAHAATAGGTLAQPDFERLAGEFLAAVRAALPAEAAYFALHGAMAAQGCDDPEGFLLAAVREMVGPDLPIVVSFDLHGVLTDRMLEHCDAVAVYHTYPHVDFYETGHRAGRLLGRILKGRARPVTARVKVPALVRGDELITETGCLGRIIGRAKSFEHGPRGLSAGVLIGNPFTDVPDLRSNSVAVADGEPAAAASCAAALATDLWAGRTAMQASLASVAEAVRLAVRTRGTAVLMDAADAPSSGASGDGNAILREVLACGFQGSVLAPVVDPPAVRRALAAGVGATLRTTVGGALDPRRFSPLEVEARVRMLSDGRLRSEMTGSRWDAGPTAVLECGRCVLVVTSRPVNLYDRSLFLAHGQDPRRFDLVVVKSPHCEPHMYSAWCGQLISVDGPGATSANLRTLGHVRCSRPMFPLDDEVPFPAHVEIYRRPRYR